VSAPADTPVRERRFRFALLALIALLPLVYVPRLACGARQDGPSPREPQWVHTVLVTAARIEPGTFEQPGSELAALIRKGSLVRSLWATSADPRAAAASLWCGRWPRQLGELPLPASLPDKHWTLASAVREAGGATCAIGAPIELPGFDARVAASDPEQAGLAAAEFVRAQRDRRLLVWVHLDWADASSLESVLAPIGAALREARRDYDTLAMVTGFALGPREAPAQSGSCPLATALPAALFPGRTAEVLLSQVDVTGLLAAVLQVRQPVARRGEQPLVSREQALWGALRGADGQLPVLVQDPTSEQLLLPTADRPASQPTRVRAALPLRGIESIEAWLPGPNGPQRAEGEQLKSLAKRYFDFAQQAR